MKSFAVKGEWNILQLTDIHIGNALITRRSDRRALAAVDELIGRTEPDMIAVTGDICYAIPYRTASRDNLSALKRFAEAVERRGIPWAPVFGNHDAENFSTATREQLGEYLQSLPNCLFEMGEVSGCGNYAVRLENQRGKTAAILLFLDSHGYLEDRKGFFGLYATYDVIQDDQIEWCKALLQGEKEDGRIPPSLAFFHIPLQEYEEAWECVESGKSDAILHYGDKRERTAAGFMRGPLFEELSRVGTVGMFCGHDHTNTYSITYRGVRLTYGMSIDYFAYPFIGLRKRQRGATLITVKEDGSFACRPVPLEVKEK